jgi:hypothetical protein
MFRSIVVLSIAFTTAIFAATAVAGPTIKLGHVDPAEWQSSQKGAALVIFAGLSGSAVADTSAIGRVFIPEMEKQGYPRDFSAAITAASSVIGPICPNRHWCFRTGYVPKRSDSGYPAGYFSVHICDGICRQVPKR